MLRQNSEIKDYLENPNTESEEESEEETSEEE